MKNLLPFFSCALVAATFIFSATELVAQTVEEPYSPKEIPRTALINMGDFVNSPLQLPWTEIAVRMVATGTRMDFEHRVAEDYDNVIGYFEGVYREGADALPVDPTVVEHAGLTHLRVVGMQLGPETSRISLGGSGLPRHFVVDFKRDGQQTLITFRNFAITLQFGGVMPARVPFKPAGADTVPFHWN